MRSRAAIAAILFGIGSAGFATAFLVYRSQAQRLVPRPAASGDVGWLSVYAQVGGQPVLLQPAKSRRRLPRPQDLSFQFIADGTGPRHVRIELATEDGRHAVVHEERIETPADHVALGYVLRLDDTFPDRLMLIVAVEAPHSVAYESHYRLELVGLGRPEDRVPTSTAAKTDPD